MRIESYHQSLFVTWFRSKYPNLILFAVPNGSSRNISEAVILKEEGVLAGVSDLVIVGNDFVFFLELKDPKVINRKNGGMSKVQIEFSNNLEMLGHTYMVGYGFEDAKEKVKVYLDEKRVKGLSERSSS